MRFWLLILFGISGFAGAQILSLDQAEVRAGEELVVHFKDGPGNSGDWIGLYAAGVIPDGSPAATAWCYTNGTQKSGGTAREGRIVFSGGNLQPGRYAVWFLANEGYQKLADPLELAVLAPKLPLGWVTSEFRRRHAVVGASYFGVISAYASDPALEFSKVSGPKWLTLTESGHLGGVPGELDLGFNQFTIRASRGEEKKDAVLSIKVCASGKEELQEFKAMTYNAWHGWGQMVDGYRKGLESIIRSDADLIGFQESTDNVGGSGVYLPEKLAKDLGWSYRSGLEGSLGILSRYPIVGELLKAGSARGARVVLSESPKREVILMNCHLDYRHYGPYAAQGDGASGASVLVEEKLSRRDEQIDLIMREMKPLLVNADEVPVVFTGDFNAPSHLDWTPGTSGSHGGIERVAWPTSTRVLGEGMKDSFREIHPDPVRMPGTTWSPVFQGREPQDRIDLIYYKGAVLHALASVVFRTEVESTQKGWESPTEVTRKNTWPSDHAAVISTFRFGRAGRK